MVDRIMVTYEKPDLKEHYRREAEMHDRMLQVLMAVIRIEKKLEKLDKKFGWESNAE